MDQLNASLAEKSKKVQEFEMKAMIFQTQIMIFKQTWTGLCERFDQQAMAKYKEQAISDSDTWIKTRLLKSLEG